MQYILLTLFYIVVALLSAINFTSPTLRGVITFFQIAANPGVIQLIIQEFNVKHSPVIDISISHHPRILIFTNILLQILPFSKCIFPFVSLGLPVTVLPLVLIGNICNGEIKIKNMNHSWSDGRLFVNF